jgi:hypothetical protein
MLLHLLCITRSPIIGVTIYLALKLIIGLWSLLQTTWVATFSTVGIGLIESGNFTL